MALHDRVQALRDAAIQSGREPVGSALQGVTKGRVRAVLTALDLATPDIVDAVFALLDNEHDSWFTNASSGTKFSDGATTAHVGSHIGILQRAGGIKLDREGRDYWIKPLRQLGAINPVYLDPKSRAFIPGHPVAKSSNCAYRLAEDFKAILEANDEQWAVFLKQWVREDQVRQRAELQAALAAESLRRVDTKHRDLIEASVKYYAPKFLPDYRILYTDLEDGDRVTDEERRQLEKAGVSITIGDAMPDVLLWNPSTDSLWVIEAVTSDGEVDDHKVAQIRQLAKRSGKSNVEFTTTYQTWRDAAARQHKHKNIAPGTYIWIQEDPSKHLRSETFS